MGASLIAELSSRARNILSMKLSPKLGYTPSSKLEWKASGPTITPLLGLILRWRYRIVGQKGPPIWNRRIQSVVGISPPQTDFLQALLDYDHTRNQVYSWGFSCLDYPLDVPISRGHISNDFLTARHTNTTMRQITTWRLLAIIPLISRKSKLIPKHIYTFKQYKQRQIR